MQSSIAGRIRLIFLNRGPNFALVTAADPRHHDERVETRHRRWRDCSGFDWRRDSRTERGADRGGDAGVEQRVIEAALGDDAGRVLPEAIRLVLLRVRVPRYQRDMLVALANRHGTTVDDVLTRELEDVACAHAEELAAVVPALSATLAWPGRTSPRA